VLQQLFRRSHLWLNIVAACFIFRNISPRVAAMVLMSFALLVGLFTVDGIRRVVKKGSTGTLVVGTDSVESNLTIDEVPRDSSWYKDFSGDGGDHIKRLFKEMTFAKFSLPGSPVQFQGVTGGMAQDVVKTLAGMVNPCWPRGGPHLWHLHSQR